MQSHITRPLILAVSLITSTLLLHHSGVKADQPHDRVRPSLVRLDVRTLKGVPSSTVVNSFVVSKDGLVLTVRPEAILDTAGANVGWLSSLEFNASIPGVGGSPVKGQGAIIDVNESLGLALLKLPIVTTYHGVDLGGGEDIPQGTALFSSGYGQGSDNVKDFEGKMSPGRTSYLATFEPEPPADPLRGSPIYDVEGRVVGITTGGGTNDRWDFVRIGYADMLLTHVRLSLVNEALSSLSSSGPASWRATEMLSHKLRKLGEAIDTLRKQITWTASEDVDGQGNCGWRISYKKIIGGEPDVKEAKFNFQVWFTDNQGNSNDLPTLKYPNSKVAKMPAVPSEDGLGGYFCLTPLLDDLVKDRERPELDIKAFTKIRAALRPIVTYQAEREAERTEELSEVKIELPVPNALK